jgi:hypothetical protein
MRNQLVYCCMLLIMLFGSTANADLSNAAFDITQAHQNLWKAYSSFTGGQYLVTNGKPAKARNSFTEAANLLIRAEDSISRAVAEITESVNTGNYVDYDFAEASLLEAKRAATSMTKLRVLLSLKIKRPRIAPAPAIASFATLNVSLTQRSYNTTRALIQ